MNHKARPNPMPGLEPNLVPVALDYPSNVEDIPAGYRHSEVGVIPDEWKIRKIGELFQARAGGDFDPNLSSDTRNETYQYPIYANSLSQQGLYGYCSKANHRPDSITITARGTLGKAFHRETKFVAIGRLLVLESNVRLEARYFCNFINHGVNFAAESTGVPQLTAPQVARYYLPFPPLSEQRAIAEALADVDELLASQEALIAKKRDIKQATMQQLLTGKIRLPGFSGEWATIRLGVLCPFSYGKNLAEANRQLEADVPVYGSNGVVGRHDQAFTNGPTVVIGRKGTAGCVHYSNVACWPIDTTFL